MVHGLWVQNYLKKNTLLARILLIQDIRQLLLEKLIFSRLHQQRIIHLWNLIQFYRI